MLLASVAQSDVRLTGGQEYVGSISTASSNIHCGDWSWNIFCGHSLASTDSRRAVVNVWRKNVHKYWLTSYVHKN